MRTPAALLALTISFAGLPHPRNFLSLYNSKTHGGFDIQLHQLFEDAGMGDVGFAEGVLTNMWAGIFTQIQKLAPGPFSPFSFSKETVLSTNSEKDRSLLLELIFDKRGAHQEY